MGDDDGGAVLHQVFQCRLNQPLGFVVQRTGGLIQNQNRRVSQQRAGNGDTLPLPAGKFQAILADFGLQALRHGLNEIPRIRGLGGTDDFVFGRIPRPPVGDILRYRAAEQHHILTDQRNTAAQAFQGVVADVFTADAHRSPGRVEKTRQHIGQCGLSAARRTHQRDYFTLRHGQVDTVQAVVFCFGIAVINAGKFNVARTRVQHRLAAVVFLRFVQKGKDAVGRRQAALQRLHHAGHTFDRVEHHNHTRQEGHEIPGAEIGAARLPGRGINNNGQSHRRHQLRKTRADRACGYLFDQIAPHIGGNPAETVGLIRLPAVNLDNTRAVDTFV